MNFTRQPIILSVVSAKEGTKLILRNSKKKVEEDYVVDAVEIVSFGNTTFFRCLERPESFLLPTGDYEILELKETKMVLKNISSEKSIKIGVSKEDKKRKLKRKKINKIKGGDTKDEAEKVSSPRKVIPPPPDTLIKEKLSRIKNEESIEKNILPKEVEDKDKK